MTRIMIVAMLALAGCSAVATEPPPTVQPTLAPTPVPTASPTPDPTPDPGAGLYLDFSTHVLGYADRFLAQMGKVQDAANSGSLARLFTASMALWASTGDEVRWVVNHPPAACYAGVHAAWLNAMRLYHRSMDLISDSALTFDVQGLTRGTAYMEEGTRSMNRATLRLDGVNCGQRGVSS